MNATSIAKGQLVSLGLDVSQVSGALTRMHHSVAIDQVTQNKTLSITINGKRYVVIVHFSGNKPEELLDIREVKS